jgi:hypothetical protein
MGSVFISYAREDRATARRLASEFEQRGWTVWWDFQLVLGERFRTAILEALNDAGRGRLGQGQRALAKGPGRRFRGAEDMGAALEPAVSG